MKKSLYTLIKQAWIPLMLVILMLLSFLTGYFFNLSLNHYGIYPRRLEGLLGVITFPLVHADAVHLFSNLFPMLVLGVALFSFYNSIAKELMLWMWLGHGILLWSFGRPAWHIGASGLIYALAFFLLFSGFLRKNKALMAISLIVITFYGSLVWGVFPLKPNVSWEGHLSGLLIGTLLAYFFRRDGPPNDQEHHWPDEEEDEEPYWLEDNQEIAPQAKPYVFRYRFRPSTNSNQGSNEDK